MTLESTVLISFLVLSISSFILKARSFICFLLTMLDSQDFVLHKCSYKFQAHKLIALSDDLQNQILQDIWGL